MASKEPSTKIRSTKQKSLKASSSSNSATLDKKLKTVVRRLPPNLPEEVFWQSVHQWVSDETVVWKVFNPGKIRKKYNKENIPSRAYIAFKEFEHLTAFSQAYDGHIFRDKAGHESQAVVEYAPCQKIPPERKKLDARNATIEQDEDFISFVQSLNAPVSKAPEAETLETLLSSMQPITQPKSTPLLDALRAEKAAAKEKEAAIRIQVHHPPRSEQITSGTGIAKKEDSKKKTGVSQQVDSLQVNATAGKKSRGKRTESVKQKAPQSTHIVVPAIAPSDKSMRTPQQPKPIPTQPKAGRAGREHPRPVQTPNSAKDSASSSQVPISNAIAEPKIEIPPSVIDANSVHRRGRPIIGLQTRHFEAALSGAGVSLSPGPGGSNDRKTRRERDKNIDSSLPTEGGEGVEGNGHRDTEGKGRGRHNGRSGGRRKGSGDIESTSGSRVVQIEGQIPSTPLLQSRSGGLPSKASAGPRHPTEISLEMGNGSPRRLGRDIDDAEGGRSGRGRRRGRGGPP